MIQALVKLIGRRFGVEDAELSLANSWAQEHPGWVALGCLLMALLGVVFYLRFQTRGRRSARIVLAAFRGLLLCLALLILAEPILVLKYTSAQRPLLWVLFDGTDSMAIQDDLSDADRERLAKAIENKVPATDASSSETTSSAKKLSRMEYVQKILEKDDNFLVKLKEKQDVRLNAFVFDRSEGVRALNDKKDNKDIDPAEIAGQLTTDGQVTALGSAFTALSRSHASGNLAGLVVVSDFDQNAGPSPVALARKLGVPIYAVGVGPAAAVDVGVELHANLLLKKAERTTITARLTQSGLDGRTAQIKLTARRLGDTPMEQPPLVIGEKSVELMGRLNEIEFPFTPEETGRFILQTEVEPLEGEVIDQNNQTQREVNIRDDFLRLMFVEYEPTWEWRFIKEVFHRDKLVGMRGFRTFLRSADPKVRQTNDLFLPTLTPQRSDFFANDVIFLGDMPSSALSTRFCEMTKEFVKEFGGGLVILSGPRFGPAQLANTPLADMLPVVVEPDARVRDAREFLPRLPIRSTLEDFMQLGSNDAQSREAWANMGRLPWYQPVLRMDNRATVLMEHPTDTCVDGRTPQPLIAIRDYGKGQVVYLGFNETWRLRRKHGETYYRQFWGQMIHRLGLRHALGEQKRFVVSTDNQRYAADEKVTVTVEAYDANFEPLTQDKLPQHKLEAELIVPRRDGESGDRLETANPDVRSQPIGIPELRDGFYQTQFPVFAGGEYRLRVKDPITGEQSEVDFRVTSISAERRSAIRNAGLQEELALATNGKSFELADVDRLPDEITLETRNETTNEIIPLWNTWSCFSLMVFLMLGEWLLRKLVNLP